MKQNTTQSQTAIYLSERDGTELRNFLVSITNAMDLPGGKADREDLISAVLEAISGKPARYLSANSRRAYAARIASRKRADFYRGHQRCLPIDEDNSPMSNLGGSTNTCDVEAILDKILEARLHTAVKNLPEKYQEIFKLCIDENLSPEEIASRLNIPVGTAKSRTFRMRKLVQPILEKIFGYRIK